MGVDVSLEELKDHEPTYKIGPSGYSFMVNRNGYVLYHPDIKLQVRTIHTHPMPRYYLVATITINLVNLLQLGSLEEPLDIDFLDVEIENPLKERIRKMMIEGHTGHETLVSLVRMPDEKHLVPQNMVYHYRHMNDSEFRRYCKNIPRPKGLTGNISQVLEAYRADHRQCTWGPNATRESVIMAAKAVDIYVKKSELRPAVVGLIVEERVIHASLMTMSANGSSGEHLRCADEVGKFVGAVDPELMDDMLKKSVYFKWLPTLGVGWGAESARVSSSSSAAAERGGRYIPDDYRVCTTREALYHFGNRSRYFMSSFDCGNCSRQYGVERVGYTNVILVVSTVPCAPVFCDPPPTPLQAPVEVEDPAPCDHPLRYRKRPDKCYADHEREDYHVCGGGSRLDVASALQLLLASALATFAIVTRPETPMKLNEGTEAATGQQATLAVREQGVLVQDRVMLRSLVSNSAGSVRVLSCSRIV
ncbi:hypothetical protein HPB48_019313 [Haemaphysalis longicornis]|uniref:Voltage-dependent calcium channel alpha-2/delta subunit conserved region domain-containing protein n=1 Tax=Haemaphysalis longicornis TaxID=44386 RepID=A0A9J6H2I4_HAELO|nr:hypothetical protein HPB48_019313 [Haemaphysalis longicornis]